MGEWRHECEWESEFADKDNKDSVTNFMFLSTDIGVGVKARVDSPLIAKQIFNTFIYPHQLLPLLYLAIWGSFLTSTILTQFHFGIFLVTTNSLLTYWSIRNRNIIRQTLFYPANHHESSIEENNVTLLSKSGRCISKHLTTRENTFLI